MWLSRRIMSLLLGTQIKGFSVGLRGKTRKLRKNVYGADEVFSEWYMLLTRARPCQGPRASDSWKGQRLLYVGQTWNWSKGKCWWYVHIWVFLWNWLVCIKTSNSNFFLIDVPVQKLLSFRDLLQRLDVYWGSQLLCGWPYASSMHRPPTQLFCVSVLSSLPHSTYYVSPWSYSRIWQGKKSVCPGCK